MKERESNRSPWRHASSGQRYFKGNYGVALPHLSDGDPRPGRGAIEIELKSGARVRISGTVDGAALCQVLEQLK